MKLPVDYKVWIAGASGKIGSELNRLLDCRELELLDTDIDDVDVTDVEGVIAFGSRNHPDVIINCAGMTDPAACEREPERAFRVNALGARNLAIASRKEGARLLQLSTDDVFGNGGGVPFNEFDRPVPNTVYGRSKLAGEGFVRELALKHIIIRGGWVYGRGEDFLSRLLRQARAGQPIPVADDQFGCPTSAPELAKLVIRLMETSEYGLYHGACGGSCSRYEFAKEALRLAGLDARLVPTPSEQLPQARERPTYTVLDDFMLRISGVHRMPGWREALADYLTKRREAESGEGRREHGGSARR